MGSMDFWRTAALFWVALGQTMFVFLYLTFPWWATFLGRALFYKAITLAVLTDLFVVARYFNFGGLDVLFLVVYGFLGVGVWWQFFAFLRIRRAGRQNRVNPNRGDHVSGNVVTEA